MNTFLKPYAIARLDNDAYSHLVEVMSYPTPDDTIMVRRVPGFPGTLTEVPIGKLTESRVQATHVHYAKITGRQTVAGALKQFPVDMLRHDFCAPLNFSLARGEPGDGTTAILDKSFGLDDFIVACASNRRFEQFTRARWASFGFGCCPLDSEPLGEGRPALPHMGYVASQL